MQRRRQMRDGVRVAVKRAISDDRARAVIDVEHGREAEIDSVPGELARQRAPEARRLARRARNVAVPHFAQRAHRRNRREAVAKALHAPAFVIDGDERRRRAQRADRRGQIPQLRARLEIAREQDDAADERMSEALAIGGGERDAFDPHEGGTAGPIDHPAASRSSAFIWRTASLNPTNTARDTIACPMWSSRTPGSAATGCTLK